MPRKAKKPQTDVPKEIKVKDPIEEIEKRLKKLEYKFRRQDDYVDEIAIRVIGLTRNNETQKWAIIALAIGAAILSVVALIKVLGWI